MSNLEIASLVILFIAVFACAALALRQFTVSPIQKRLDAQATIPIVAGVAGNAARHWVARVINLSGPLA